MTTSLKISGSPIAIRGIDHVVLRIEDLDASLAFYCQALGCTVERRIDALGLIQLRAGTNLIDLVPVDSPLGKNGGAPPGAEARNVDHFALQLESFDEAAIRAHLAERGISAGESGERYGAEGTGPSIYVSDPDNNVVELKGPPSAGR